MTAPESLQGLVDRFDASAFDPPPGEVRIRLVVEAQGEWDVLAGDARARLEAADLRRKPDAIMRADAGVWEAIRADVRGGLEAYQRGRLLMRHNLHLGVAFLAATSGARGPARLEFRSVDTPTGRISYLAAGLGEPVLLIHGLGATKGSFLPTVAGLAGSHRAIALDLPGFGDSYKPFGAPYHAPFFARAVVELMDALGIRHAHMIGNSMGGRVALEIGLRYPERVGRLVLLAPSLAWRRERRWTGFLRLVSPELGLVQVTPRWMVEAIVHRLLPSAEGSWIRAGVDEFLRAYLTPRGRVAFYAAARQIYLEEPHGAKGFWTRLATLAPPALFVWGKHDTLVPLAFATHVQRTLPLARQVVLDCGHVPQIERPRETDAAILAFLREPASTFAEALRLSS